MMFLGRSHAVAFSPFIGQAFLPLPIFLALTHRAPVDAEMYSI
jgi:hypothetical protein